MGDIPMSDVDVRQPRENLNSIQNNDGGNPSVAQTMIGLGPLRDALTLTIKQRMRAFELMPFSPCCEVRESVRVCILLC